jgi:hypothetical protein
LSYGTVQYSTVYHAKYCCVWGTWNGFQSYLISYSCSCHWFCMFRRCGCLFSLVLLCPAYCLEKPDKKFLQLPNKSTGYSSSRHWNSTAAQCLKFGLCANTGNWTCRHVFLYLCKLKFLKFVWRDILEPKNIMQNKKIS